MFFVANAGRTKCCSKANIDVARSTFAEQLTSIDVSTVAFILHQAALILELPMITELCKDRRTFSYAGCADDFCAVTFGFTIRACFVGTWGGNTGEWNNFTFKLPQIVAYGCGAYGFPLAAAAMWQRLRPFLFALVHDQPHFAFLSFCYFQIPSGSIAWT